MPNDLSFSRGKLYHADLIGSDGSSSDEVWLINWTDWRTGTTNSKYKEQIRNRENATTVLEGYKRTMSWKPGYVLVRNPIFGPDWSSEFFGTVIYPGINGVRLRPAVFPKALNEEANALALSRFINRCVDAQRSFQGGTFTGEILETLRMIRNPARALRRDVRRYSSRAKKLVRKYRGKDISKILSGLWLEHWLGWQPLLSDIKDGMEALNRYDPNPTIDVQAGAKLLEYGSEDFSASTFALFGDFTQLTTFRASYRYKGEVWATPPYARKFENVSKWGFDPIRDFVPTIYNLIPYTFLLDYFSNLGTVIQSWFFWKSNLSWFCRTNEQLAIAKTFGHSYYKLSPNFQYHATSPERHTVVERFVRRDVPPTLVPSLTFRLPGAFSMKWLNIAALAAERLAR